MSDSSISQFFPFASLNWLTLLSSCSQSAYLLSRLPVCASWPESLGPSALKRTSRVFLFNTALTCPFSIPLSYLPRACIVTKHGCETPLPLVPVRLNITDPNPCCPSQSHFASQSSPEHPPSSSKSIYFDQCTDTSSCHHLLRPHPLVLPSTLWDQCLCPPLTVMAFCASASTSAMPPPPFARHPENRHSQLLTPVSHFPSRMLPPPGTTPRVLPGSNKGSQIQVSAILNNLVFVLYMEC